MNTIHQLSQYAFQELKDSYSEYEIKNLCHIIYMDVLHFTNIDIHLRKNEVLEKSFVNNFLDIIKLLQAGHPIQYIIGETVFSGLKFGLNGSTLIPRPETEELVLWAKESLAPGKHVLDIGTGSGCIAISLSRFCPEAQVEGVDISSEAIQMAGENALRNRTNATFRTGDILTFETQTWHTYDVIVSNPPYIRDFEKQSMESRVVAYEPHLALFVPDGDPLLFYRRIAQFGMMYLKTGGELYFEINEALGEDTVQLLEQIGYQQIELKKDFYQKDRMVKAKKQASL